MLEISEGPPKMQAFVSHGDFRQYLYEAPIFSMPSHCTANKGADFQVILALEAVLGLFVLVFG
jgi:hypothetical protein